MIKDKHYFMGEALKEAKRAQAKDEVPVGAVIVLDGKIIARGHNNKEEKQCAVGHAEIVAIRKATKKLGSWRLCDCEIFVTLEPCTMCCSAITHARIAKLCYGATDKKGGGISLFNYFAEERLNHKTEVQSGIREGECGSILSEYFAEKRRKAKLSKTQKTLQ